MLNRRWTQLLSLMAAGLLIAGCGGGDDDRRGSVVIEPPAAQTPAADDAATESPAEAVAQAPAAEAAPAQAEPEMKEETPAAATEVAAAETPEPAAAAAEEKPAAAQEPAGDKGTTFKGRIVVTGEAPPRKAITPSGNDAYCIDLGSIPDDEVLIGEGGGLASVFVWVRKVPDGVEAPAPPEEPAVLDQKGCRFLPPALVVQVGQTLLVKNDDATLHNTRMSGLAINFNQTVSPNNRDGVPVDITAKESVPIPVKCDIHGWMSARVLSTDNPWYAISDADGNFEINNLPAGVELDFRLQHGTAGYIERSLKLTLEDGEVKEQTFELDASKLSG